MESDSVRVGIAAAGLVASDMESSFKGNALSLSAWRQATQQSGGARASGGNWDWVIKGSCAKALLEKRLAGSQLEGADEHTTSLARCDCGFDGGYVCGGAQGADERGKQGQV